MDDPNWQIFKTIVGGGFTRVLWFAPTVPLPLSLGNVQSRVLSNFVPFRSVPWLTGSSGKPEGLIRRDFLPVFSAGGYREQFWYGQGCPLFDIVRPEFPLPTTAPWSHKKIFFKVPLSVTASTTETLFFHASLHYRSTASNAYKSSPVTSFWVRPNQPPRSFLYAVGENYHTHKIYHNSFNFLDIAIKNSWLHRYFFFTWRYQVCCRNINFQKLPQSQHP